VHVDGSTLRTDDFLLGHKQGQFVLPGVRKLAQLHSTDFGTNVRSQFDDLGVLEKIGEGWVCVPAVVVVVEQF